MPLAVLSFFSQQVWQNKKHRTESVGKESVRRQVETAADGQIERLISPFGDNV